MTCTIYVTQLLERLYVTRDAQGSIPDYGILIPLS